MQQTHLFADIYIDYPSKSAGEMTPYAIGLNQSYAEFDSPNDSLILS
jgi:hypothetical protein